MVVRLDFFDDIFVPKNLLFAGSRLCVTIFWFLYLLSLIYHDTEDMSCSDHTEQVWVWESEGTPLYFDKNESVRLRVESETWNDQLPTERDAEADAATVVERKSPYSIQVSCPTIGDYLV